MNRLVAAWLMCLFAPPLVYVAVEPHYYWVRTIAAYLFYMAPALLLPGLWVLTRMTRRRRMKPWHFALAGLGLGGVCVASWPLWTDWDLRFAQAWIVAGMFVGFCATVWLLLWIAGVWRNPALTGAASAPWYTVRAFAARTLGCMALVVAVMGVVWAFTAGPLRSAEQAWSHFQDTDRDQPLFESQICDPLITAGKNVHPVVIEAIADRNMPLRRYAIHFLGEARVAAALPALRRIVLDATEHRLYRVDALEAICQISPEEARTMALAHTPLVGSDDFGVKHLREIEAGRCPAFDRRSYFDAVLGASE